jgi:hypothetical protein
MTDSKHKRFPLDENSIYSNLNSSDLRIAAQVFLSVQLFLLCLDLFHLATIVFNDKYIRLEKYVRNKFFKNSKSEIQMPKIESPIIMGKKFEEIYEIK